MPSVNKVTILGHLARDPELKYTPNAAAITNFTVATSWGSGDNKTTEWHQCEAWNSKTIAWAEQVAKMSKGDLVYLEGRLKTRSWEVDNGERRYKTTIVCNEVHFMRSSNSNKPDVDEDSTFPGLVAARKAANDPYNEPPF